VCIIIKFNCVYKSGKPIRAVWRTTNMIYIYIYIYIYIINMHILYVCIIHLDYLSIKDPTIVKNVKQIHFVCL